MPHNRFYYPEELEPKQGIFLKGNENTHLFKVMRLSENEEVEIVNGKGSLAFGKILQANKEFSQILIQKVVNEKTKQRIILAQSMMRTQKIDLIIEKATELGVSEFIFFPADHSEKTSFSSNQLERMHNISISATKQSGRLFLPSIQILTSLKEVLLKRESSFLYGDLSQNAIKLNQLPANEKTICLIIGPEKGFSQNEQSLLEKKATGVTLSKNILRAETAAILSVGLLNYTLES